MISIDDIRKNIDKIDDEILELLNKRASLAIEIKKTSDGKSAIRPEREIDIVKRLEGLNKGPMPSSAVRSIFTQIIASFRDHLQLEKPISVSYLGPEGTYSHLAAQKLFGDTITLVSEDTISGVIRSVEAGTAQLAVVPIENSTEGAVRETHKKLMDTNVSVVSETTLPITHCLLSKSKLSDIKTVYGHPQALAQCRIWLATHLPKADQTVSSSNSAAAVDASKDSSSAAIAGENAAKVYGLNIVEAGINDQPGNETRFIALGNFNTNSTGDDKTSMICVLNDKAGALYELLGILAEQNISMTRLESHPIQQGQYAFYIDFIGHKDDPQVKECLKKIDNVTRICKVLGSYPAEIKTSFGDKLRD